MRNKFLILTMLFIVLLFSGCNTTKGALFTDIVKDEVSKISMRHSGSGILYTTTNADLINQFVSAMKSDEYYESNPKGIVGASTIHLYNKNNEEIANITFEGKGTVCINDKSYTLKTDISLESFYKEFLDDKNIVKEK